MSVYGRQCLGPHGLAKGCKGRMNYEYSDKMLYNQLLYFRSLFDVEKAKAKAVGEHKGEFSERREVSGADEAADAINALVIQNAHRFGVINGCVGKYLEKCGRRWVGMGSIFGFMAT